MKYGYVRSATQDKNSINVQIEALESLGVDKIIVETSGHDLDDLIAQLQEGDSVHVKTIDRISRKVYECKEKLNIIECKKCELYMMNIRVSI